MQGYTLSLGVAEDAGTAFPIVSIVPFHPSAVALFCTSPCLRISFTCTTMLLLRLLVLIEVRIIGVGFLTLTYGCRYNLEQERSKSATLSCC
jgi:hypothetical protein